MSPGKFLLAFACVIVLALFLTIKTSTGEWLALAGLWGLAMVARWALKDTPPEA